jgi:hypothetical protein
MDLLAVYYYAGTPVLMCNLLFYSITTLSNSISSSQNVFKFISEHVEPDYIIFKETVEQLDLENRLKILNEFIFEILEKYCKTHEIYEELKKQIVNEFTLEKDEEFIMTQSQNINFYGLNEMPKSLQICLISLSETIYNILNLIKIIHEKIIKYKNSYIKSLVNLKLKCEMHKLNNLSKILDIRSKLFFDLVNIYKVLKVAGLPL